MPIKLNEAFLFDPEFQHFVSMLETPIAIFNDKLELINCNATWYHHFEISIEADNIGKKIQAIIPNYLKRHIELQHALTQSLQTQTEKKVALSNPPTNRPCDCWSVIPWFTKKGELGGIIQIMQHKQYSPFSNIDDITKRLHDSESQLRLILQAAAEGIYGMDTDGKTIFINPAACHLLGYDPHEIDGKNTHALIHHSHIDKKPYHANNCPILHTLKTRKSYHSNKEVFWRKDGSFIPVDYTATPIITENKATGIVVTFNDITHELEVKQRLIELAHFDYLTHLPNRAYFEEKLLKTLDRAKRNNNMFALLYIDLDDFKFINDSLGHDTGDLVLKKIASELKTVMRSYDFIARLGGDEFAIILEDINSPNEAGNIADKIITSIGKKYNIKKYHIGVGLSIGIACFPYAGKTNKELIKNADIALYRSKGGGRNQYQFFSDALNREYLRKISIEDFISKDAFKKEAFLVYQPQIELKTGRIVGVEVLTRWHNIQMGPIPTSEFISIAEEIGRIQQLSLWIYHNAFKQFHRWKKIAKHPIRMALNLSPIQLARDEFIHEIYQQAKHAQVKPNEVELELTETAIMTKMSDLKSSLKKLHEFGFLIAIDDFGTGHSSLARLKSLPVSTLKIDTTFVRDIASNEQDASIIQSIISLAQNLKLDVIAEGIETKFQLELLKEYECQYGQGFYFARPMPADELCEFIKNS